MKTLVIDIGGTNVKFAAQGSEEVRKFPSGRELTPAKMVEGVKHAAQDWKYDRVSIGYPDQQAELAMVDEHAGHNPMDDLQPVSDGETVHRLIETVRGVHMAPEVRRYAVDVVAATRGVPEIRLGASPRATLHLVRAARAQAALSGRDYVVPDDLHTVAVPVLAHRLMLTTEAHAARRSATDVVRAVLHRVPVPQGTRP